MSSKDWECFVTHEQSLRAENALEKYIKVEEFREYVVNSKLFIVNGVMPSHTEEEVKEFKESCGGILPLPFPSIAIELAGGGSLYGSTNITEYGEMLNRSVLKTWGFKVPEHRAIKSVPSIVIFQHAKWVYMAVLSLSDEKSKIVRRNLVWSIEPLANCENLALWSALYLVNDFPQCSEKINQTFKVKSKSLGNSTYRVRNIVNIAPKKDQKKGISEVTGKQIQYSHRFRVRGHWRKIGGIGKAANGEYGILGKTWVVDFIKGENTLKLIEKPRVYLGNKPMAP